MCLGIPGLIVQIDDAENLIATVDVCGVRRQINASCVVDDDHPIESCVGDWVLIHVGFAMSRIDEDQAAETLKILTELGEAQASSKTCDIRKSQPTAPAGVRRWLRQRGQLNEHRKRSQGSLSFPAWQAAGRSLAPCGAAPFRGREGARFARDQRPLLRRASRRADQRGKALADVYRRGGQLFSMGNGGSSCDASHVAVEFVHPITAGRPALAATNLVADLAMISAVGNDVGFEHVFVRQIIAHGKAGDGLIGISTSGNSSNLISAFAKAKEMGLVTIGLAGGDGGRMKSAGFCDHCLVVPTTSIHRIQECHVTAYHILWDLVHTLLADDRGSAARKEAAA